MGSLFYGYARQNDTAGTRNYIGVVSSVICSSTVVHQISDQVDEAIPINHTNGCAQLGDDLSLTKDMLIGVTGNPNLHSALLVGLGCETNQISGLLHEIPTTKPLKGIGIQQLHGGKNTIAQGTDIIKDWQDDLKLQSREELPLSKLRIGIISTGQSETSLQGMSSIVGGVVDEFVRAGAGVVVGVTKSFESASDLYKHRLPKRELSFKRHRWEKADMDKEYKQKGSENTQKTAELEWGFIGIEKVKGLVEYGDKSVGSGLHLMRTSSNIVESVSRMASVGCNLVVIVSAEGVMTGSIVLPCINVAHGGEELSSELIDYSITAEDREKQIENMMTVIVRIASGEKSRLELLELGEFSIPHVGTPF